MAINVNYVIDFISYNFDNFIMSNLNPFSKIGHLPVINTKNDEALSYYDLHQTIGKGGFSEVKRATHLPTGEKVAAKIIHKNNLNLDGPRTIRNQIEIHRKMIHQSIIRIYEVVETAQKFYIFMEYCPKGDIFDCLHKKGKMSEEQAGRLFIQIFSAIQYLHDQNISHRDIKLQNILLDENINAKLADFGFAKKYIVKGQNQMLRTFCGSPSYTPPQIVSKYNYDPQLADVWSLGVTLYAMLTAELPFGAVPGEQLKKKIKQCNFMLKSYLSYEAQILFLNVFKQEGNRIGIKEVIQSRFYKKHYNKQFRPNFINTEKQCAYVEPSVLKEIQENYQIASQLIKNSVCKQKPDRYNALYLLIAQKNRKVGKNNGSDLDSVLFRKRSKTHFNGNLNLNLNLNLQRKGSLSLLKTLKNVSIQISLTPKTIQTIPNTSQKIEELRKQNKKSRHKIFLNQDLIDKNELKLKVINRKSSINIEKIRFRQIDESPDSPKRILDCVNAYKN